MEILESDPAPAESDPPLTNPISGGASGGQTPSPRSPGGDQAGDSDGRDTLRILRDDPMIAIARLRERIRSGEADYRTWHNLAIALERIGQSEEAIEAVQTAIEKNASSSETHFLLGLLLRHAGRLDEAIDAFDRVADLDEEFPRLYATRGVVHFHRADYAAALGDFEEALARSPMDVTTLFNLTILHVAGKDYMKAQEGIERLIEIDPKQAREYYRFLVELGEVRALDETLTQAHRIKNLLSVVGDRLRRFYSEYRSGIDPEGREDLRDIRDEVGTVYGDMVGLLGAIRPRPMQFTGARVRRVIDRIAFVAMTRARGIQFDLDVDEDLPELVCDVDLIQEALLNLLLNSIEAVLDRYQGEAGERGSIQIHARSVRQNIVLLITDNGAGIADGDLDRVFRLGFTTKRLGSGIGLAHTRRIIEEHGGEISVHATGPEGSTMRIELPVTPKPSEKLIQQQQRARLLADPRELVLEEPGHELGL